MVLLVLVKSFSMIDKAKFEKQFCEIVEHNQLFTHRIAEDALSRVALLIEIV